VLSGVSGINHKAGQVTNTTPWVQGVFLLDAPAGSGQNKSDDELSRQNHLAIHDAQAIEAGDTSMIVIKRSNISNLNLGQG
jgi:hypothetical protein